MRIAVMVTAALLSTCSCAFVTESPRFAQMREPGDTFIERVPAKVHMLDGSVVIFSTGISVGRDRLYPVTQSDVGPYRPVRGVRYDLTRQHKVEVEAVPTESVVGIEYYDRHTNVGSGLAWSSIWISAIAGAGAFVLAGMILAGMPW